MLARNKLKEMTEGLIRSLGVGRYLDWASISAVGASGGIVVYGILEFSNLLERRKVGIPSPAILEPSMKIFSGCLQGFMVLQMVGVGSCSGKNRGLLEGSRMTLGA